MTGDTTLKQSLLTTCEKHTSAPSANLETDLHPIQSSTVMRLVFFFLKIDSTAIRIKFILAPNSRIFPSNAIPTMVFIFRIIGMGITFER